VEEEDADETEGEEKRGEDSAEDGDGELFSLSLSLTFFLQRRS